MSIRVLGRVWRFSRAKGGDLLVLLAIADFSDDDGIAYPSVATLGKKARLTARNVQRAIRRLVSAGELIIDGGKGPNGAHLYRVTDCQMTNHQGDNLSDDNQDTGGVTFQPPNPLRRTVIKINNSRSDNLTGDDLRRFERFWAAYPKKEGKGACRRWWELHRPDDVLLDRMLVKIEQAMLTPKWKEQDGKFMPMPATWLNQERWDDEYTATEKSVQLCTERVQNGDSQHLKPCGKPVALDQPPPVRTLCSEHLHYRQRIDARLSNGDAR